MPTDQPATALVPSAAAFASNWDERARIAKVAAATGLVPKAYQGKYEDCLIAMQYGAEIGLPPMASLQGVSVIGGKPGVYGDAFLGVVMAAPAYRAHREFYLTADGEETRALSQADLLRDETRAVAEFYRRGIDAPFVAEFSIADAKRARLWNKDGPWRDYPARMLKWRAREFAARDGFAAELRGITIRELLEEDEPFEAPPILAPVRRSLKKALPDPVLAADRAASDPEPPEPPGIERTPEDVARFHGDMERIGQALAKQAPPRQAPEPPPEAPGAAPGDDLRFPDIPANLADPLPPAPPLPFPPKAPPRTAKPDLIGASDSVVVTDTAFVQRPTLNEEPYYEIRARVSAEGKAPIAYVFVTRDKPLFELAASAEGSEQTFAVTWRNAKRQDGSACKILDSIEAN